MGVNKYQYQRFVDGVEKPTTQQMVKLHAVCGIDIRSRGVEELKKIKYLIRNKGLSNESVWKACGTTHRQIIETIQQNRKVDWELILRAYDYLGLKVVIYTEFNEVFNTPKV